ncbi:hypothetical protein [Bradyrhizobium sp. 23]|uniref:hypothetical protein n=1 Tax=Bradyrhizobium sp. 23 TaxID=2782667 RepID=UPI001FFA03A2|nr:hypothetical protein [Bradyrhizobium sp. 23]MCK1317276.1 hypothetical protein [Bradyrhizobium sp. 23]
MHFKNSDLSPSPVKSSDESYLFHQTTPSFFERWRRYAAQWMASLDWPYCRHGGSLELIQDIKAMRQVIADREATSGRSDARGIMWTAEMQKRPQINLFAQERGKAAG